MPFVTFNAGLTGIRVDIGDEPGDGFFRCGPAGTEADGTMVFIDVLPEAE